MIRAPVGVTGLITPWNSNAGFICNKLATALATGCTAVIKPSEMSALQTQSGQALHEAGLPSGYSTSLMGGAMWWARKLPVTPTCQDLVHGLVRCWPHLVAPAPLP